MGHHDITALAANSKLAVVPNGRIQFYDATKIYSSAMEMMATHDTSSVFKLVFTPTSLLR